MKNIRLRFFIPLLLTLAVGFLIMCAKYVQIKSMPDSPPYDMQEQLVQSIHKVMPGVVYIKNDTMRWSGSGVAVTCNIILTARHVAEGGKSFTIVLNDGTVVKASRAILSKEHDFAFIKVDKSILKPVRLGVTRGCKVGQIVFAIGSPYGKMNFNSATLGIISGFNRNCDEIGKSYGWSVTFTTDAAGHPGNSGCPVFTLDGVVRGVLVGGHSPVLIYCIPVDLFIKDHNTIEMMFNQDAYYLEDSYESGYEYY